MAESPVARVEGQARGIGERLGGFAQWLERSRRSPLYVCLLRGAARDAAGGGVVARAFEGIEIPAGSVPALRLMAALHYLVLRGQAPALGRFYPSVGGTEPPAGVWPAAEATLREHLEAVRARLRRGVQTNEPGRSAALYGGLLWASERFGTPLRLLEFGASAGLNLLAPSFGYRVGGELLGAADSPLVFEEPWVGRPVARARVAARGLAVCERRGCDRAPIDVRAQGTRELLLSYVWPDEAERLARLERALALARAQPPLLERAQASTWLRRVLSEEREGTPVVFQSVVWQYLSQREREAIALAIEELGSRRAGGGLVWLTLEPGEQEIERFELAARVWPGATREVLAHCDDHGPAVCWLSGS